MSVAVGRRIRLLLRLALLGSAFSLVALAQTEVACASCHDVLTHLEPSLSGQGVEHTEPDRPDELPEDLGLDES